MYTLQYFCLSVNKNSVIIHHSDVIRNLAYEQYNNDTVVYKHRQQKNEIIYTEV